MPTDACPTDDDVRLVFSDDCLSELCGHHCSIRVVVSSANALTGWHTVHMDETCPAASLVDTFDMPIPMSAFDGQLPLQSVTVLIRPNVSISLASSVSSIPSTDASELTSDGAASGTAEAADLYKPSVPGSDADSTAAYSMPDSPQTAAPPAPSPLGAAMAPETVLCQLPLLVLPHEPCQELQQLFDRMTECTGDTATAFHKHFADFARDLAMVLQPAVAGHDAPYGGMDYDGSADWPESHAAHGHNQHMMNGLTGMMNGHDNMLHHHQARTTLLPDHELYVNTAMTVLEFLVGQCMLECARMVLQATERHGVPLLGDDDVVLSVEQAMSQVGALCPPHADISCEAPDAVASCLQSEHQQQQQQCHSVSLSDQQQECGMPSAQCKEHPPAQTAQLPGSLQIGPPPQSSSFSCKDTTKAGVAAELNFSSSTSHDVAFPEATCTSHAASKAAAPAGMYGIHTNMPASMVQLPAAVTLYDPLHGFQALPLERHYQAYRTQQALGMEWAAVILKCLNAGLLWLRTLKAPATAGMSVAVALARLYIIVALVPGIVFVCWPKLYSGCRGTLLTGSQMLSLLLVLVLAATISPQVVAVLQSVTHKGPYSLVIWGQIALPVLQVQAMPDHLYSTSLRVLQDLLMCRVLYMHGYKPVKLFMLMAACAMGSFLWVFWWDLSVRSKYLSSLHAGQEAVMSGNSVLEIKKTSTKKAKVV